MESKQGTFQKSFDNNGIDPDQHTLIQGCLKESTEPQGIKVVKLVELFAEFDTIDVLYLDLQPGEHEALKISMKTLNKKARRMFVRTHAETDDREVEQLFGKGDWLPRWIYRTNSTWSTYWGLMEFPAGCQVWLNKALLG